MTLKSEVRSNCGFEEDQSMLSVADPTGRGSCPVGPDIYDGIKKLEIRLEKLQNCLLRFLIHESTTFTSSTFHFTIISQKLAV